MNANHPVDPQKENLVLRQRLAEAEEIIDAIRSGGVDAFVAENGQVYTLQSADYIYRVLVDTMNQGAVTLGTDGAILYANRKFSELVNLPADELLGRNFTRLVHVDDQPGFGRLMQHSLQMHSKSDVMLCTPEGKKLSVLLAMSTLVPYGIPAISVLVTDLTEQKRNEETALVRKRLEMSQSAGHVGTFDWDLQTGVILWTKELEQLFGLPPGGFEGNFSGWAKWVHAEDLPRIEQDIADVVQRNRPFHVEYRIIHPDGSLHWIEAKGSVEYDGQGKPLRFVGVNLDITERKQLEIRLERSNAELAEYAAVASHDLQAPLRTISSYLGVLEARYSELFDEKARKYFSYITSSTTLMGRLIRGILEYSQAGGQDAPLDTVDCNQVVREALNNLEESIRMRGAQISVGPLPMVRANHVNLTRLFQNLIGNAIKFCAGGPCVSVTARRSEHEWTFAVSDNGPGIEKEFSERIFKLFQRLTSEAQVPGSGIGLATCKKIVERHGGRIWVESVVGDGSTFYFTIPC
jgi:PAS domain S-box-containing protein